MTATHSKRNKQARKPILPIPLKSTCIAGLMWTLQSTAATSPGADNHTVALWLFDEPAYPNVILTDASRHGHDLRLTSQYGDWAVRTESKGEPPAKPLHVDGKYGLVAGKFGRALHVPDPVQARVVWPDQKQRYSSESMVGSFKDVPERFNIGYFDWTIEFWFKARGEQSTAGTIYVVRNEQDYPRGLPMENSLRISPGRESFTLVSRTTRETTADLGAPSTVWNLEVKIPTDTARLDDGDWHHVAFTYSAEERQIRHWVDGKLQPLPEKGGFLPMLGVIKEVSVGANVAGLLDEYRLSDNARYTGASFKPPASFSFSHQAEPRPENRPNGPVPLFAPGRDPSAPLQLGSRKHVLIDGAIIDTRTNIAFRPQPPQTRETTDFKNNHAWEPTPRLGSTIPDITTIWDEGDELRMIYTNTGMWGGKKHVHAIATSKDGLRWSKPVFGLHSWEGERDTNIVLDVAGQGALI